jgi:hypothetical protein
MSRRATRLACLGVIVAGLASSSFAYGALDWHAGVRGADISVCFAGDAPVSRPARVTQIAAYLREFTWAANIRFSGFGSCAAPTKDPNGNDHYAEDIRVVIPGTSAPFTGAVPGMGCASFRDANGVYNGGNDGGGSWSAGPNDGRQATACLYILKLNDDAGPSGVPYLNHTLHEFGHGLGLAHEHERSDVDKAICSLAGFGGGATTGFVTPYDRFSVMHYNFATCGIDGNYGYGGLSDLDRLALHIMYPESDRTAEYVGTTVLPQGATLQLQSAWQVRGANISYVANGFAWKLGSSVLSTQPSLAVPSLPVGEYNLSLTHGDFIGRAYSAQVHVRVLTTKEYASTVLAPIASASALGS